MAKTNQNNYDADIVLNRMYVGDYLSSNLGHEVINMYQADNGNHYLYLNAYGSFAKKRQGKIKFMLLTRYHDRDCAEVIGKAINLCDLFDYNKDEGNSPNGGKEISQHQLNIIKDIKYGDVPLIDLFENAERQNVYVTFKAEKVLKIAPNKKILIHFVPQKNNNNGVKNNDDKNIAVTSSTIDIYLNDTKLALASLDQFFEQTPKISERKTDYDLLYSLFSDQYADFWTPADKLAKPNENFKPRQLSLFDICQIQNDENRFSFALKFFMEKYPNLWCQFFYRHKINLDVNFTVAREVSAKVNNAQYNEKSGGRIDLLISDINTIIVIENKIKSDINSIDNDGEGKQLRRYFNYANWLIKDKQSSHYQKAVKYIILTPKYNIPKIEDEEMSKTYKTITYADLYAFLKSQYEQFSNDANFVALYEAMHRHTLDNVNDYLYYEMQEKLHRRISEFHQKKQPMK